MSIRSNEILIVVIRIRSLFFFFSFFAIFVRNFIEQAHNTGRGVRLLRIDRGKIGFLSRGSLKVDRSKIFAWNVAHEIGKNLERW